ncbi:DUF2283 domain-containing protein [candidate division KSB1 bacterium]|nr:DUF2283 domain-containing protein [candidate division KSB1 bacterium]NIR70550.1 DUF2283 domain-containing protein [candidate division KSB1 bacterium]NIS27696.1 DUF2283 domain-containing protein [candidate division KSB1 bacterium]NIT74527.1 DUF2283 domain-containing protein [candidate division KSB1 bacterium]NIU91558.1 DUF2283 domain-containing protein [candidate division KSB1 bacterium]
MDSITFSYDDFADTLYIYFGDNRPATEVPINDSVLLRIDWEKKELLGLTIFDYKTTCQRSQLELYGLNELGTESTEFCIEASQVKTAQSIPKKDSKNRIRVFPIRIESAPKKVNIEDMLAA